MRVQAGEGLREGADAGDDLLKGADEDADAAADLDADADFRRGLDAFLTKAGYATTWRVEQVLKVSDFETTELVTGEPELGRAGRYVRKRIDASSGAGSAYRALWDAQREGRCPVCVPRLVELGSVGDELTVVMEFVEGATVDRLVAALGSGESTAGVVMPALCEAVAQLHECFDPPLIHRDLKPSNVIMRDGSPVIIDFGSARQWRDGAEADTAHFLTRCYAPPEQFGFGQTDVRSDVYALGKMLYFCVTGQNPPNVCDAAACEKAGLGREIAEIVCRACAFDPGVRYGSARELGEAVARVVAGLRHPAAAGLLTMRRPAAAEHTPAGHAMPLERLATAGHAAAERLATAGQPAPAKCSAAGHDPQAQSGNVDRASTGSAAPTTAPAAASARATAAASEPSQHPSSSSIRPRPRLVHWLCCTWNLLLLVDYAVIVMGSIWAIAAPNAHDALLPLWFRVFEYVGVGMVSTGAVIYLLMNKRALRESVPALAQAGSRRWLVFALAAVTVGVGIPMLMGMAAGLI
ncbi:MAG: protein kinase [Coriobacteriaceae bacterium]|nr:protein kinase [Coriobacteriaceae bacterium]